MNVLKGILMYRAGGFFGRLLLSLTAGLPPERLQKFLFGKRVDKKNDFLVIFLSRSFYFVKTPLNHCNTGIHAGKENMKRRRTPEERYKYSIRKQQRALEDFAEHEFDWAKDLMLWYKLKKVEMPIDEYRACAFFLNKEYRNKPGSLTLLYEMNIRFHAELTEVSRENAFDILRFQFKSYAKTLEKGGFSK